MRFALRTRPSIERKDRLTLLAIAAGYVAAIGIGFYVVLRCGPSCEWMVWGGMLAEARHG